MILTVLIALIGLAVFIWGLAIVAAFSVAARAFAKVQATGAYATVRDSGVMKSGEALVDRVVDAVPSGLARRMIRTVVPQGSDMAGSVISDTIEGRRSNGKWLAALGAAIFVLSFIAGPWLTTLIARG